MANRIIDNCGREIGASSVYLKRPEAAEYCVSRGLPVSPKTLAKWVTIGGGPVYRRFGRAAVYLIADLDAWIESKLTPPRKSSSPDDDDPNPFPAGSRCADMFDDAQARKAAGHWSAERYPRAGDPNEIVRAVEDGLIELGLRHQAARDAAIANASEAISILRDLVATIELHTDCMSNQIDREALDEYLERADKFLARGA